MKNPLGEVSGKPSQDQQDNMMHCSSNFEDHSFHMEESARVDFQKETDDVDVDIVECTNSGDHSPAEERCGDETECSTSFDDTLSDPEDGLISNDLEVVSSPIFGSGIDHMGKKKVTDQWKRFVRPIVWRCKWIELKARELQRQAQKYDRELAYYNMQKQSEFEKSKLEGLDSKLVPLSQNQRNRVMKRKKRKRVEETANVASYMSDHNIFSYFAHRKPAADDNVDWGHVTKNVKEDVGFSDEWASLEFRDGDNCLKHILLKIEQTQAEAQKLKARIDKVVSEHSEKFVVPSSRYHASFDATTSGRVVTPRRNGDSKLGRTLCMSSELDSEGNTNDVFMPASAVPNQGDMMIQTIEEPCGTCSPGNVEHGIRLSDEDANAELHNFERVINQVVGKPQVSTEITRTVPSTSGATKKRKRGKRKAKRF